jgi:hypothetical protein
MGLEIILLAFALILVNQTVNMAASDALLDYCSGYVELSGNSKLSNFNGTVVARNATLEIVDSRIDNLYCYDSKIEAYHNLIRYVQLENCTMIASLNTFAVVIGNNSSYANAKVTFTVLNKTMTDYVGNHWLFASYANEVIDNDWDYVSDNLVCPKSIRISNSHYCERILRGLHESYTFHGVVEKPTLEAFKLLEKEKPEVQPTPTTPTPAQTPEQQPAQPSPTPAQKSPGFEAIFAISGLIAIAYLIRKLLS